MHRSENFRKIVRIFIMALVCSEMHLTVMKQANTHENFKSTINLSSNDAATLDHSKHHVSIRLALSDKTFGEGHICSGAIIAPSVVLTAAHCIYNYQHNAKRHPAEFKVVLGTLNRYQRTEQSLVYGVTHAFYPNSFEPMTLKDNIALLLLDRDIPDGSPVAQPISLLTQSTNVQFKNAADYILTGWGKSMQGITSSFLLMANATKLPNESCAKAYAQNFQSGTFCAGFSQQSVDICLHDDIGAPLVFENQLVGIKTSSNNCRKNKKLPALYTDIVHHTKWIKANIGTGTNQNSSIWGTVGFLIFTVFTLKAAYLKKY